MLGLLACLWTACSGGGGSTDAGLEPKPSVAPPPPPSVLLVLINDLHPSDLQQPAVTANLARLQRQGVQFTNAVAYAGSSATRAAVLTGRYGRRTGFGGGAEPDQTTWELPLDEMVLAELLARSTAHPWSTSALGTWHLSSPRSPHAFDHPNLQGFDHFAGPLADLTTTSRPSAFPPGYQGFEKTVDGRPRWVERYVTEDVAADAVAQLHRLDAPWLLFVAPHALRGPHTAPPARLHSQGDVSTPQDLRRATLQATDRMLGTILDSVPEPERTVVIVLGSARDAQQPSVPLIVTGPGFRAGTSDALVHAVDVFPTVAELVGIDVHDLPLDGVSFAHLLRHPSARGGRQFLFTEHFAPVGTGTYRPGPYDVDDVAIRSRHLHLARRAGTSTWTELGAAPMADRSARRRELRHALDQVLTQ